MDIIRNEIRTILKEVFSEAAPSTHFKDRVYGRLSSTLYTRPSFDYSEVEKQIDTIRAINFNPGESFAIFIKKFPVTFVSKDPVTGNPSIGNELWAVVRDNVITTIFFRNSHQKDVKVKDVSHILSIKTLYRYYAENEKNADGTVDFDVYEVKRVQKPDFSKKRNSLNLPIVELDGAKWYIDEPNEQIIYVKNIKKSISFNDLDEKYLEKVINAVITN
ncbi:MAG: hypothetical protein AABY15_05685 [Nanoarchaeota archaeon]